MPRLGKAHPGKTRILFGSCNKARLPQPLWPHVLERRPDVWIWGGDNVYGDQLSHVRLLPKPGVVFEPTTEEKLKALYAIQLEQPGYVALLNSSVPIVGTWDDHDLGINDGDGTFLLKHVSRRLLLEFLREPAESPRWQQPGVYASRQFEFEGGSVRVILLDVRFNKDPYGTPGGDFLGEEQWRWLEGVLARSTARVHLVVSSLQLLEPRSALGENWGRFRPMRERLLRLLTSRNLSAPIVLSGDVHFAELSAARCRGGTLFEVTSSGMTHSWGTRPPASDNWLVSKAMAYSMRIAQRVMPWRYQLTDTFTGAPQLYLGLNFGELEFDWQQGRVAFTIFGDGGQPVIRQSQALVDLDMQGTEGPSECVQPGGEPPAWRPAAGLAMLASSLLAPPVLGSLLAYRLLARALRGSKGISNGKAKGE